MLSASILQTSRSVAVQEEVASRRVGSAEVMPIELHHDELVQRGCSADPTETGAAVGGDGTAGGGT